MGTNYKLSLFLNKHFNPGGLSIRDNAVFTLNALVNVVTT